MSPRRRPLHVVSFAIPVLSAAEAEAIIDLLEQLRGILWDTYGDAILGLPEDEHGSGETSSDDGDQDDLPPS